MIIRPNYSDGKLDSCPICCKRFGQLAVITAEIEQTLHQIYWKHAGLDQDSGPIVTDNLNPKRLSEDILKFARLDPAKANIVADLELLLSEFEALNTTRNSASIGFGKKSKPKSQKERPSLAF